MSDKTARPLQLLKANLEFQLQVGRLLQQSGQHWAELASRSIGEEVSERDAEIRELLRSGDWQALSALPANAFWRQAQQRLGDGQELARSLMSAQNTFAVGLGAAVQAWQRASSEALATAGTTSPEASWREMVAPWERLMAACVPPTGAGGTGSARSG